MFIIFIGHSVILLFIITIVQCSKFVQLKLFQHFRIVQSFYYQELKECNCFRFQRAKILPPKTFMFLLDGVTHRGARIQFKPEPVQYSWRASSLFVERGRNVLDDLFFYHFIFLKKLLNTNFFVISDPIIYTCVSHTLGPCLSRFELMIALFAFHFFMWSELR